MKRILYVITNGIMTRPGQIDGFTNKIVTGINTMFPDDPVKAENPDYWAGPLTRRFRQQRRAKKIVKMISYYVDKGFEIVYGGHSNGCDMGLRVIRLLDVPVKEVHFFAPACEPDLEKSGMAEWLRTGKVGKLKLYISGKDKAMRFARIRIFGLGYGNLGGQDPEDLRKLIGPENVIYEPKYGHGTWFDDDKLNETIKRIIAP